MSTESAKPRKGVVRVGSDSRAGRDGSKLDENEFNDGKVDGGKVGDNKVGKKIQKTSKSKNLFKSKNLSKSKKTVGLDFFTSRARLAFNKLIPMFVKAPILYHFDPEYHIWVETNVSGYAIDGVISQLILDNLD